LGTPKQLLLWREEPLIRHVARLAIDSHLEPIIVVTGYHRLQVEMVLSGLPQVLGVYNPDWLIGQSTSIRSGLPWLKKDVEACLFFMSDQPQIPINLVKKIVNKYVRNHAPIIAPSVGGRRGNPVLFDRVTFKDLMKLTGNEGGRKLFDQYPVEYVEWKDASILIDVDTMDNYQQLIGLDK